MKDVEAEMRKDADIQSLSVEIFKDCGNFHKITKVCFCEILPGIYTSLVGFFHIIVWQPFLLTLINKLEREREREREREKEVYYTVMKL